MSTDVAPPPSSDVVAAETLATLKSIDATLKEMRASSVASEKHALHTARTISKLYELIKLAVIENER